MAEFARITGGSRDFPKRFFDNDTRPMEQVYARKVRRGTLRGTQGVGGQKIVLDSDNEKISVSTVSVGQIANENKGIVVRDSTGTNRLLIGELANGEIEFRVSKENIDVTEATNTQLIFKDDFSTRTYYDDSNSRIQIGKLPDDTYGIAISKPGNDVEDAF